MTSDELRAAAERLRIELLVLRDEFASKQDFHRAMTCREAADLLNTFAANITFPRPAPPKPGSLWEHRETGERRFVNEYPYGGEQNYASFVLPCGDRGGASDLTWHAWAANAVELE